MFHVLTTVSPLLRTPVFRPALPSIFHWNTNPITRPGMFGKQHRARGQHRRILKALRNLVEKF